MENSIQNARDLYESGQYKSALDMCLVLIKEGADLRDAYLIFANSYLLAGVRSPSNKKDTDFYIDTLSRACSYAETIDEAYLIEREARRAVNLWEKVCVEFNLHLLEENPTMNQWNKYIPIGMGIMTMCMTVQYAARNCAVVNAYCQENSIGKADLFKQLEEKYGKAEKVVTERELGELEYNTAQRIFANTQNKLAANNDATPEYLQEVVKVVLGELYMVRLVVGCSMPDEGKDPEIRCKHLKLKAEITSYMLSAMIYPNGKPMTILSGDSRSEEISDLKAMYDEIQMLDPSFVPPELPSTPGVNQYSQSNSSSGGCYVATAVYGSYDCPEVWTLRRFRDYTLAETWYGRAFIRTYYAISPTLVRWFGHTEWFNRMWKPILNKMVRKLNNNGVENTAYCDKDW